MIPDVVLNMVSCIPQINPLQSQMDNVPIVVRDETYLEYMESPSGDENGLVFVATIALVLPRDHCDRLKASIVGHAISVFLQKFGQVNKINVFDRELWRAKCPSEINYK